jgi:hypothetical protein
MIYGFFKDEKLIFAVEISQFDYSIRQARGKYNIKLNSQEKEVLDEWYEMFFSKSFEDKFIKNIEVT